jgi:hypothetical protein
MNRLISWLLMLATVIVVVRSSSSDGRFELKLCQIMKPITLDSYILTECIKLRECLHILWRKVIELMAPDPYVGHARNVVASTQPFEFFLHATYITLFFGLAIVPTVFPVLFTAVKNHTPFYATNNTHICDANFLPKSLFPYQLLFQF